MSWFLIHSKGLSLVSGEGFEESFYSPGPFEVAEMARMAGKLVINMQAERPTIVPAKPAPTPPKRLTRSAASDALVRKWEG